MKLETKLKHTPGPWSLADHSLGVEIMHTRQDGLSEAHACLHGSYNTSEANARLIAAAPDMLDALMHVVALLHATHAALDEYVAAGDDMLRNPLNNKRVQDIADMATDALTKAIGETQE